LRELRNQTAEKAAGKIAGFCDQITNPASKSLALRQANSLLTSGLASIINHEITPTIGL
jgi:hypothetical protein